MKRLALCLALVPGLLACGEDPCDTSVPGNICTIAGNGDNGYDRDADDLEIPALEARMSLPQDTLTAPDGTLYILDWNNHRLRSVEADGMLRWVAGRGELGGSLDDPANGDFNHPTNMIFDDSGDNIIIAAWHNSKIREIEIATGGVVDTCGNGGRAYFGDEGPALTSTLDLPASVAWDPEGNLVIMDQANQVLRRIDSNGTISLLAGQCIVENTAPCAVDQVPVQCPDRPDGSPSGKFTCGDVDETCAGGPLGACTPSYSGDEIPATELRMAQPFGQSAAPAGRIAYDDAGNLYFADTGNNLIRMIDTDGVVHRVAGQPPVDGVPQAGYSGDGGPATDALLSFPVDLAFDDTGTLYFSDVLNHCIRAIDTAAGTIRSVAGQCGVEGYEGDGGPASDALLLRPFGIEWHVGRLNISDTGNSVVRTVLLAE